ncbi:MAG TPA: hypothetical protein H9825_09105 [Candidatus Sphingobacterium stercorigallinarum]|nr:hypothetical protein [Candidatus Sphingobacterium stercorigallinarum]
MIAIHQQPQAINYSQNIPDIRLTTDQASIRMDVMEGEAVIVEEEYGAPPQGTELVIKLCDLLENFMEFSMPVYSQAITTHDRAIKEFQIKLTDADEEPLQISFKVLQGFLRFQPTDIQSYHRDYWLNLTPFHSEVYFHQPLYLTAVPPVAVQVKLKATMISGSEQIITLGSMTAGTMQSVNLNPGKLIHLLGAEYYYVEVYTENSRGEMVTGLKRLYYRGDYAYQSDVFFYQNRLGGWDTLVLNGDRINRHKSAAFTALIQDIEYEYHNDLDLEIEKNSGYMATEEDYRQYIDFLFSKRKYFLYQGALIPIVTSENKSDHTRGRLNSYSFIFRTANTKERHPEIGAVPPHLIIT